MFSYESADYTRVQWIGMKDDADAGYGGQAESSRKAEGVKEGKNAHDAVIGMEHEDLAELFDVGRDIVMREHDSFGFAGGAAGEDNGGDVVEGGDSCAAAEFCNPFCGKNGGGESCKDLFERAGGFGDIFNEKSFARRLNVNFFEEDPSGDNCF